MIAALDHSDSNSRSNEETVKIFKERKELTERFAEGVIASADVLRPVKIMSREESKSGIPSKLKKAGVTLIALPDPVTGAVGVPMLAAGVALEKLGKRELTIPQVTADLAKMMKALEQLRRSLR